MSYNFTYTTSPTLTGSSLGMQYGGKNLFPQAPQGRTGNIKNVLYEFGTIPAGTYSFTMIGVLTSRQAILNYYYAKSSLECPSLSTITSNCSLNASNPTGGGSCFTNITMCCTFSNSISDTYTVYYTPVQGYVDDPSYPWPVNYYGSIQLTRIA